ncbi:MAG: tetraacyldisaccharide 4'-kinase [Candidatus Cryptobacteroides sp.]
MSCSDKILLAPYYWTLRLRHKLFDSGVRKVLGSAVPTVCIGNITVGGTGKTPHTEMLVRLLSADNSPLRDKHIAVLSRGYKRKSKGFGTVRTDGTAKEFGDEPLQIKRKFPATTVAVDRNRIEGCCFLAEGKDGCPKADIVILDDAFQYRKLKADLSIVLVDYNRPVFNDHLLPLGQLRDIPERLHKADVVIVTKCPPYLDEWERSKWKDSLRFSGPVLFSTIAYDPLEPVFPEGDRRYTHSQRAIMFSGIANDSNLEKHLSDSYRIVRHFKFADHHNFSRADIQTVRRASREFNTAIVVTTEKDSQRLTDCPHISEDLKERLFKAPIRVQFLTEDAESILTSLIVSRFEERQRNRARQ